MIELLDENWAELVEGQGGSIQVDSEPGQGSTVSYTVPVAPSQG